MPEQVWCFPNTGTIAVDSAFIRLLESMGRPVIDMTVTPWREAASCLDAPDGVTFFPHKDDLGSIVKAKVICAACPVADVCLTWAIETNQSEGIWGGHTAKERRKLRRRWMEEIRKAS